MAERQKRLRVYYDASAIIDAPEYHGIARALGMLTTDTWQHDARTVADRVGEFIAAYPADDPTRFMSPGLVRLRDGAYELRTPDQLLVRFAAADGRVGSLHELLSRYGLKLPKGPSIGPGTFEVPVLRETVRRRNYRLRVLHGSVDLAPESMDAAKADLIDRQEKRRAADEVRAARKRLRQELEDGNEAKEEDT